MRSASSRAANAATSAASAAASAAAGKTSRPQPKANPPPPPPRTAYQARQQEASFGTRRATGFAPTSPLGDEPQVKSQSQHYTNSHTNVFEETAANLRKAKAQPADTYVDPLSEQFGDTFLDNRQRTPYASHVGEKTNPFEGASATRAKSERESWRQFQKPDNESTPERPHRQRSASVGSDGMKSTKENKPFSGFGAAPNLRYPSQASARYSPRPADPNVAPAGAFPFPSATGSTASVNSSANGKQQILSDCRRMLIHLSDCQWRLLANQWPYCVCSPPANTVASQILFSPYTAPIKHKHTPRERAFPRGEFYPRSASQFLSYKVRAEVSFTPARQSLSMGFRRRRRRCTAI